MKRISGNKTAFCLLLIFVSGCGIKANPVPVKSSLDYVASVRNMEAFAEDDSVILKWNFQDSGGKIDDIRVERSELGSVGNECPDCPRTFTGVCRIPLKEAISGQKAPTPMSYRDKDVVKGKTYDYRLSLCDDLGICQETSAVSVNYK